MTNEEAIEIIKAYKDRLTNSCSNLLDNDIEAFTIAIEAMEENEKLSLLYSDMANEIARLKSITGER